MVASLFRRPQHAAPTKQPTRGLLAVGVAAALIYSNSSSATIAFEDVSIAAGMTHAGETFGSAWGDVNSDGYPDVLVSNHRSMPSVWLNMGDGTFKDTASQVFGFTNRPRSDKHGGSWADFDNDGDDDLFLSVGSSPDPYAQHFLYNERGALLDGSVQYNIKYRNTSGRMPIWVDFNRDGMMDSLVMQLGNNGVALQRYGSIFTDRTSTAGFYCGKSHYGQLFDVNDDGQLDYLCAAEAKFPQKVYSLTRTPFTDITSMLPSTDKVVDSVLADFNNDGRQDMFNLRGTLRPSNVSTHGTTRVEALLTGGEKGFNFVSDGPITINLDYNKIADGVGFNRVKIGAAGFNPTSTAFTLDPTDPSVAGMPTSGTRDYPIIHIGFDPATKRWTIMHYNPSGTGFADAYFQVDTVAAVSSVKTQGLWASDKTMVPKLISNYPGRFVDETAKAGLAIPVSCVSAAAGDFDNDMDQDLYLACRTGAANIANVLYENQGNGTFLPVPGAGGAEGPVGAAIATGAGTADAVTLADYNGDGFLDLFVTNGFNMRPLEVGGPDKLFRNTGNINSWIELDLVAKASARDAIGARVYATAGGITQLREQNHGYHRWSQNYKRIHFGLAQNGAVDLRVVWPSGRSETFANVTANKIYQITEGTGIQERVLGSALPYPCGVPEFDGASDAAIVIWKDCAAGAWRLRALAGGTLQRYVGSVSSSAAFASVTTQALEFDDVVETPSSSRVDFDLTAQNASLDALNITPAKGTKTCLNVALPPDTKLLFGLNRVELTPPFELDTLKPCTP